MTQLKGKKPRFRLDVDLNLDFVATNEAEFVQQPMSAAVQSGVAFGKEPLTERIPAFIPITYVSDPSLRIRAYRDPVVVDLLPAFAPGEAAFEAKSCVDLPADLAAKLIADPGAYYVNVHTEAHPDGAMRGQLAKF